MGRRRGPPERMPPSSLKLKRSPVEAGPYGPEMARRAVVVSTDPERLPTLATWYLATNLPTPSDRSEREKTSEHPAAGLAEVVRLHGLRMWVEQSYKQIKYALGFSNYQVRSDPAIRRHWQLVCCAFSFCWWAHGRLPASPEESTEQPEGDLPAVSARGGEKETAGALAGGVEDGKSLAGAVGAAVGAAVALLEGILRPAPTGGAKSAARTGVLGSGILPLRPLATNYRYATFVGFLTSPPVC